MKDFFLTEPIPAAGCSHANTKVTLTPHLIHHARKDCVDCGKFIGWISKPETLEREHENHRRMKALSENNLTEWEKGFLLSLEKQGRHFSPKQQATLDKIYAQFYA